MDAHEALRQYIEMGESRSLHKLAEQAGVSLSLLKQWSGKNRWQERLTEPGSTQHATEESATPDSLSTLESKQSAMRAHLDNQRSRLESMQRALASKLSAQRAMVIERAPLQAAVNTTNAAVTSAQEALSRHIGSATESIYADKLYEAEQAYNTAKNELATFDQKHLSVSNSQLQTDRDEIARLSAEIDQETEHLKTLSNAIVQATARELNTSIERILTVYLDLYTTLEKDGPTLARLRTHDPRLFNLLMRHLSIDESQLFELIQPYHGHNDPDFRPFLRRRQAETASYIEKLTTNKTLV